MEFKLDVLRLWPGCAGKRCTELLDREEARLLASRLNRSEDPGLGTSGKSGNGLLGASPGALPEETYPECSFVGLMQGFDRTGSVSGKLDDVKG